MIVMFADLAGYTALTDIHGDDQAVAAVEVFHEVVSRVAEHRGMRVLKGIADAYLLTGQDAAEALVASAELVDLMEAVDLAPAVRIGIHCGPVSIRGK